MKNHYDWLEKYLPDFFKKQGLDFKNYCGIISAHGDKCYSYRAIWHSYNIPFEHGIAIYLLSYCFPFSEEVRNTKNGWVKPDQWVVNNYDRFFNKEEI